MRLLIILCILGAAFSSPSCRIHNWGDWGKCMASKSCSGYKSVGYQLPDVSSAFDHGRIRMQRMMEMKKAQWRHIRECRAAGTCPEMSLKQSEGPAECIDGQAGPIDDKTFPCRNLDVAYFVDFEDLSGGEADEANDLWGWTDPETGDEYALVGLNWGTSFVRITDPENPVVVGYLSTNTYASLWRDIKVVNDHAFIVSEASGHGMQVFDLSQLRDSDGFQVYEATALFENFGNAHNIVANDDTDFVYVVGATQSYPGYTCGGGLLVIDVSDPINPTFAGCYGDDGYTHDAQCIVYNGPDTEHLQKEICFGYNEDTLTIVDVTNKENMFYISRTGYDGASYTHQGWITEDHTTVLLDDELDEIFGVGEGTTITYIWDVTDLDAPVLQNNFVSTETVPDHNQYIRGDRVYQSNYQAGLRILDIDQENFDLNEVAYFDVFPALNSLTFAGSWSNYPYFESGIIPVSSMEYGLFLLRANEAGIQETLAKKTFGQKTRFSTQLDSCPILQQTRGCVPEDC